MLKKNRPGSVREGMASTVSVQRRSLEHHVVECAEQHDAEKVLGGRRGHGGLVVGVLVDQAPDDAGPQVARLLQVPADAATEVGLEADLLFGALEAAPEAGVVPVVPAHQVCADDRQLVARGGVDAVAVREVGIERERHAPPGTRVVDVGRDVVGGRVVALGVADARRQVAVEAAPEGVRRPAQPGDPRLVEHRPSHRPAARPRPAPNRSPPPDEPKCAP